jgi:tripartite ATP-independent transporter DctP family solute receptor
MWNNSNWISKAAMVAFFLMLPTLALGAEAEYTLRFATVAPDNTPWAYLLKKYKKALRKKTDGRVKMKVFLGGLKGDEQSLVRQTFKGKELQGAGVSSGAMATLVPEMDILELPYLFDSFAAADKALDGPGRPIIDEILEKKGFKLLMFSENGYRSFGTKGGFVKSPKDLKARKMRSQESPVHVETYRALGASPVTISVGEVLSALQTGVVEGFDNTPLYTQAVSWYQAVDHYTVTQHIYQPALIVVNKAWFEKLPADLQAILLDLGEKLTKRGRKKVRELGPALLENFATQGVKVHRSTDAEKAAFKKATRPVWNIRRSKASPLGKKLMDTLLTSTGNK